MCLSVFLKWFTDNTKSISLQLLFFSSILQGKSQLKKSADNCVSALTHNGMNNLFNIEMNLFSSFIHVCIFPVILIHCCFDSFKFQVEWPFRCNLHLNLFHKQYHRISNISVKWMFLATVTANIQSIARFQCKFAFSYSEIFWSLNVTQWEKYCYLQKCIISMNYFKMANVQVFDIQAKCCEVPIWILCKSLTYCRFSFIPASIKIFVW